MAFNINPDMKINPLRHVATDELASYNKMLNELVETKARERAASRLKPGKVSSLKEDTSCAGITWKYVIVDDAYIRIEKCLTECEEVVFPDEIDGMPVLQLGTEVCSENEYVRRIMCADSIQEIGSCAFRLNPKLEYISFPKAVSDYAASWVQHCQSLREMVLPGALRVVKRAVLDNHSLRTLTLGSAVEAIEPGAFEDTQLQTIRIAPDNKSLMTDGDAIYTHDGHALLALARPVSDYRVADGCAIIGRKAAKGIKALKHVYMPDTLSIIGEFAFAHTGLVEFTAPASLQLIQEKAFYHCSDLRQIGLNLGLKSIGDSAFAETSLQSIFIPASIEHIGSFITDKTNVVHSGSDASFCIDPTCPLLSFDGEGGLYRTDDDGLHMVQLIDRGEERYCVMEGTRFIDPYAFAFHNAIQYVHVPEGVQAIGDSAFRVCPRLSKVDLPSSVRSIGKEAFLDTVLASFQVPADLQELGKDALVTLGAHHISDMPTLHELSVAPGNESFYVQNGILCQRGEHGDKALMFDDVHPIVSLPDSVTNIAAYAFNNAQHIEELSIGPSLKTISTCGLSTWSMIKTVRITLAQPEEGRTYFEFHFPDTYKAMHEISLALGGSSWINIPEIYRHYDNCVANAHDYHNDDGIPIYDQVKRILNRLDDPIFLTPVNRSMYERTLRLHIIDICVDVARNDDRAVMDQLIDLGYLNDDNLEEAIMAVRKLQDAAMTGYLLEVKRRRFGQAVYDFDL